MPETTNSAGPANRRGPLAGIKVLDVSHLISGPHCAMIFADHGADVIKLEPLDGEPGRRSAPRLDQGEGESLFFACHNRIKRSIGLDLKHPGAAPVLDALLRLADVVVTNYSRGVPERLGLGYEHVSSVNPAAVMVQVAGFGSQTPYRNYVAYDGAIQAMSGFVDLTTTPEGVPVMTSMLVADHSTAAHAALAAMCALWERQRTGKGQYVEVNMLNVMMSMLAHSVPQYGLLGPTPRFINGRPALYFTGVFDAADGPVYIAPLTEAMWTNFCEILGRREWAATEIFEKRLHVSDPALRATIESEFRAWAKGRKATEAADLLQSRGIVAAAVRSVGALYEEEIKTGMGTLTFVRLATDSTLAPVPGPSFQCEGENSERGEIPALGAHTQEILAELGFGREQIARLQDTGVVSAPGPARAAGDHAHKSGVARGSD